MTKNKQLPLGCHLSISLGYEGMGKEALRIGANTFAFFMRNPKGGKARPLDIEDMNKLSFILNENNFAPLVAHAPYSYNLCSQKEDKREFAINCMKEDLSRLEYLPGNYLNFHPGFHTGQGVDMGVQKIVDSLNQILFEDMKTTVLLETMAGKGTEIGANFEQIKSIIDGVELSDKLGVCIDTCHVHDGGYPIVADLDKVLSEFDNVIGLDRLKALHINDSKNECNSHKDRHEKIGDGYLGIETFKTIVNHPLLSTKPMILETPHTDNSGYQKEIALLRSLRIEA